MAVPPKSKEDAAYTVSFCDDGNAEPKGGPLSATGIDICDLSTQQARRSLAIRFGKGTQFAFGFFTPLGKATDFNNEVGGEPPLMTDELSIVGPGSDFPDYTGATGTPQFFNDKLNGLPNPRNFQFAFRSVIPACPPPQDCKRCRGTEDPVCASTTCRECLSSPDYADACTLLGAAGQECLDTCTSCDKLPATSKCAPCYYCDKTPPLCLEECLTCEPFKPAADADCTQEKTALCIETCAPYQECASWVDCLQPPMPPPFPPPFPPHKVLVYDSQRQDANRHFNW